MKKIALLILALAFANVSFALDILTRKGVLYRHCESIKSEPDGIRFTHSDGTAKVPFEELQADLQKQYGYDPEKAAAFRKATEDAKAAAAKRVAIEERAKQQKILRAYEQEKEKAENVRLAAQEETRKAVQSRKVSEVAGSALTIALWVFVALIYFLPTVVAAARGKANVGAIAVLNLLAGWTAIGWLVALVWACTKEVQTNVHTSVYVQAAPSAPYEEQRPTLKSVQGRVVNPKQLPPKS